MEDREFRDYAREALRQMGENAQHPSLYQLAGFVQGELTAKERGQIEQHAAQCAECRERLDELELFLADAARPAAGDLSREYDAVRLRIPRGKVIAMPRRWTAIAAAVLAAFGLTYAAIRVLTPSTATLLAQSYTEQRSFDFRIAGAQYAPVRHERGGGSAFASPAALLKAQAKIAEEVKARPDDPDVLRMKGEAEMVARQASAAVETLRRALDLRPGDAKILADCGIAFALRGDIERQFGDFTSALDYLGQSLQREPRNAEARFNLALVLERLMQFPEAAAEWQRYLELDRASEWAAEARKHLEDLAGKLKARAGAAPDPEWYLRESAVPARATMGLRPEMVRVLKEQHGDRWAADAAEAAGSAGWQELAAARTANRIGDAAAGLVSAHAAQKHLSGAGALWARFEEVVALRLRLESVACLESATPLVRDLDAHPYPWLQAQARIEQANCAMRSGRLGEAAPLLREAMQIARQAKFGDAALRGSVIYLDCISHTGLPSEFFASAEDALKAFWSGAYRTELFFQVTSRLRDVCNRNEQRYAALALSRGAVWGATGTMSEAPARADLAGAAQEAGEEQEARANLDTSEKLYRNLPAGYRLHSQLLRVDLDLRRNDADAALALLGTLRPQLEPPPAAVLMAQYFQALGDGLRKKGSREEAMSAYRTSIEWGVRRIASLNDEAERAGAIQAIENSYRGLISAMLASGASARDVSQAWRGYRALDAAAGPERSSGPDVALSFVELPDGLVSWLARGDQVTLKRWDAPKDKVLPVAARFLRECSDPSASPRSLRTDAEQLFAWMIEPFAAQLPEGQAIAVELDGALRGVPIEALMARDGRYFGESHVPVIAAGSGGGTRDGAPGSSARVLAVMNPAVTGESAERFPSLPETARESEAIRAAYPGSTFLEGAHATLANLESALAGAEIVHFAGHGYADANNGALLLAPRDPAHSDYDLLRAGDLRRENWSRCRLAVLSACAAAAGETRGPHNPDSLVRALTKAGASQVAASLWNADSAATAELMQCFYAALAGGASPGRALQTAQQKVRSHPEWAHPYYWAGFQLYGTT